MDHPLTSLGPAFTASRVVTLADLPEEDREKFMKFFVEQKIAFFHDSDGSYVANIRMYDPNVVDLAPKVRMATVKRHAAACMQPPFSLIRHRRNLVRIRKPRLPVLPTILVVLSQACPFETQHRSIGRMVGSPPTSR